MTTATDSSSASVPPARRRLPLLVRLLLGAACLFVALIALLVVAVVVENVRGRHAWERYRAELVARGEKLDAASLKPAPVPAEDNFAMTPFLAPLLDYDRSIPGKWRDKAGQERAMALGTSFKNGPKVKVPGGGNWEAGRALPLDEWQAYFADHPDFGEGADTTNAAIAVLTALRQYDPILAELKQAASRPSSNFPIHYDEAFNALLPHLAVMKGLVTISKLRAVARLGAGQTNEALEDIRLGFRLSAALREEPLLISQLVRLAMVPMNIQPIWEGMARQQWSEPQLAELQALLEKESLLESYGLAMRGERAFCNAMFDQLRAGQIPASDLEGIGIPNGPASHFIPSGWIYQNQLTINRVHQEAFLPVMDSAAHRVYRDRSAALDGLPELRTRTPYNILAAMLLPALSKAAGKFAYRQASVDLARVGCALERFRLTNGRYPERLDELAPKFLARVPKDVMSGEPLRYRREDGGRYVLYSVGWNEQDDGGEVAMQRKSSAVNMEQGDWVWRLPELP